MSDILDIDNSTIESMINSGILIELIVNKDKPVTSQVVLSGGAVKFETVIKKDGKLVIETVNENVNPGDIIVTNLIEGYENSYVMPEKKFKERYEAANEHGEHFPKDRNIDKVIYIMPESLDLRFKAPWGSDIIVYGDGAIVPEDPKDFSKGFYGINAHELRATHSRVEGGEVPKHDEIKNNTKNKDKTVKKPRIK